MWTVIKVDKKRIGHFKEDLKKKLGYEFQIYFPKILIQTYKNKKLVKKNFSLLGDYIFCFHEKFKNRETLESLKFLKGLKYFVNGLIEDQKEISDFINKCKKSENNFGYISNSFFELNLKSFYKFQSGLFTNKIFQLIGIQKNKINILMGNLKTTVKKEEYLFQSI